MIRGELVNLRAIERTDAPEVWHWFNDSNLMRHWGMSDAVTSLSAVQTRIEGWLDEESRHGHPVAFIIEDLESTKLGMLIFGDYRADAHSMSLSLLIGHRDHWGKGLGTDTLRTAIEVCFSSWALHRLWLHVEAFNERAQRLYERCGFKHEGTLRDASYFDGAYRDVEVYGLLATDYSGQDPSG